MCVCACVCVSELYITYTYTCMPSTILLVVSLKNDHTFRFGFLLYILSSPSKCSLILHKIVDESKHRVGSKHPAEVDVST